MQNILFRVPSLMEGWSQPASGGPITYSSWPTSSYFFHREQRGYTGKRPKTGPLPAHSYFFRIDELRFKHTYDHYDTSNNHTWGRGDGLSNDTNNGIQLSPTFDAIDNVLSSQALSKLTEKVRGDLDISVDIAEGHKTLKMLRTVDQFVEYSNTFARKYGALKVVGNAWLQYIYGAKPLLSTIYGCADENLRTVINRTARHSARASGRFNPDSITFNTLWGSMTLPTPGASVKRSWTYGVDVTTDQFDMARWSSLNPLSIAWELLPYSFVVDWVYNVGGYLRNMETAVLYGNKFRSGYRTRLTAGVIPINVARTSLAGFTKVSDTFTGNARLLIIEREPLTTYPAPRLPSFNARLGSSRLFSAAALLAQQLKGRPHDIDAYLNYLKGSRKDRRRRWLNRHS